MTSPSDRSCFLRCAVTLVITLAIGNKDLQFATTLKLELRSPEGAHVVFATLNFARKVGCDNSNESDFHSKYSKYTHHKAIEQTDLRTYRTPRTACPGRN
jgi:hypothetical protein